MPFPFGFTDDNGNPYDLSDAELAGRTGSLPMDAAELKYLQRDGGDIQGLGVGIEVYSYSCFYLGSDYDARLRGLRASFHRQPKGLLSDPELGNLRAHCMGVPDFTVDYMRERECVNFRIVFKRDATEVTDFVTQSPSVSSKAASLTNILRNAVPVVAAVASVATTVASFPSTLNNVQTDIESTMEGLGIFVTTFANSAVQTATLGQVDFTLSVQRTNIYNQCATLTTALRQSGLPDAALYPALSSVQQIYAETLELDTLVRTQTPQIETVVIQGRQPIVVLAAQKYGGPAAMGKVDEIRINNQIGTFGLEPGQVLRLAGPTLSRP